jgi:arylsulfatase A-like enzyme
MAQKSIVLVTVDCLRADHVGFMGYKRPTTPFLDALATESLIFPTAIVAGVPTYYSFPAILASRYPLALGRDVLGLAPDEPTLASVLKEAGYATASFGAANPYISSHFGYAQGFDTFRDFLDDELAPLDRTPDDNHADAISNNGWLSRLNRAIQKMRPSLGSLGAAYDELYFQYCRRVTPAAESLDALRRFPAADVIVDHARDLLASFGDSPFFLWLHLMDPHAPYYPKGQALDLMENSSVSPSRASYLNSYWNRSDLGPQRLSWHRDEVVNLYDAGIRWVDEQMRRLVDTLRLLKRWDQCIFALTADHGEEFLDHGDRFHPPSRLSEELIHVPLLVRVPESPRAKNNRVASVFSMLHLAPTLLDAAQLPVPPAFQGRSYWPQVSAGGSYDAVAISESVADCTNPFRPENRLGGRVLSIRESRFKLMLRFGPKADELYDLEADPGENAPLAPTAQKPIRRRLLEIAHEHLQRARDERMRVQARLRELRIEWKKPAKRTSPVISQPAH